MMNYPDQVTNWFGNKRIRFKKSYGKSEEELNVEESSETQYSETNPDKDIRDSGNVDS
jgi:hypothetical protein